eukprot:755889-Hanusia_phi.AAC.9
MKVYTVLSLVFLILALCCPFDTTSQVIQQPGYNVNCGLGFGGGQCERVRTCEEMGFCNGHGICQRGPKCLCSPGWTSADCSRSVCPSNCSGHGTCSSAGGCICDSGYTGTICSQAICLGSGNCSGHGLCLPGGICSCDKGYLGLGCEVIDAAQKCSNHGSTLILLRMSRLFSGLVLEQLLATWGLRLRDWAMQL